MWKSPFKAGTQLPYTQSLSIPFYNTEHRKRKVYRQNKVSDQRCCGEGGRGRGRGREKGASDD